MKRLAVVVSVVWLFALPAPGHSADLQAGWYVKLGLVDVRGWDGIHPEQQIVDWNFTGSLGPVGPFVVGSPDPVYARRMVSVPATVYGVAPGTSVDLWGEPVSSVAFSITGVVPFYDTNYDATQMRLQLLMYRADRGFTLLWEQARSGAWGDWSNVLSHFSVGTRWLLDCVPSHCGAGTHTDHLANLCRPYEHSRPAQEVEEMRSICALGLLIAVLSPLYPAPAEALTPAEVLVLYNSRPSIESVSQAVAAYYGAARSVPTQNVVGIDAPTTESASTTEYCAVAASIWDYLSQPEYSHINCIVLCYGIPSRVGPADLLSYYYSVDSALTLLGNAGIPEATPWGVGNTNPYCGKNVDFGAFRDSSANAFPGPNSQTWKLNYLVTRLDGFSTPTVEVNGIAIPRDVKALVDRSIAATAGGKFIIDRTDADALKNQMVNAGMTATDIVADQTNAFLTGQQDVMGYFGEHMSDGNANTYTTWGRPFNSWRPDDWGGIALANTNDGQSFRTPRYVWGPLTEHGTPDAHTLTVTDMHCSDPNRVSMDQCSTHQVVLCAGDSSTLAVGTFNWGTCTIHLANVSWPDYGYGNHSTYLELRFPSNDPQHPGAYIPDSRTPHTPDNSIWNARENGITYSCGYDNPSNRLARVLSAEYITEGASGTRWKRTA